MTRKILLPFLSVIGVGFAIAAIMFGDRTPPGASVVVVNPTVSPFATSVAGAGIVEASSENIAIGTPVSGIATAIPVKWGDQVNSGDVLFKIDDRDVQGQLLIANAKVKEAEATLAKIKNLLEVGDASPKVVPLAPWIWPIADSTSASARRPSHRQILRSSNSRSRPSVGSSAPL